MNIQANVANKTARLLIVDDEPAHMTALYHTLEDAGYDVTAFPSAMQALELFAKQSFDLVLTDLQMPDMNGINFLRAAQELDTNVVGIVMTGHGAIDTAIEAMKAGAIDYVLKPFKLSTILPVLSRALEVRRLRLEIAILQERVREHMVELEASNKELESFSYSVSHDLRAPLRAISGYSTILKDTYSPQLPEDAQHLVGRIMTSAERMSQLIEHLLRFSRLSKQSINKRSIDTKALVTEIVDELRKDAADERTKIQLLDLPNIVGDVVLIRQVFINLISNALKFSRKQEQPIVTIGSQQLNGELVYFVNDNGAGFDMQNAENLFRVFNRLHSTQEFEGNGVGLSLVQRIVQRHGGRIWAEAAVNRGATFYFTVPNQA